jgi:mannan endo-1,4-beta-mannosidase
MIGVRQIADETRRPRRDCDGHSVIPCRKAGPGLAGFLIAAASLAWFTAIVPLQAAAAGYVHSDGTQFILDGKEFYVTGVNNHYLSWASDAEITRVLDDAVALGANVVRTFLGPVIGSPDGEAMPTIWRFQNKEADTSDLNVHGRYVLYWDPATRRMAINPDGMRQTDFFLAEAARRRLKVLLVFLDFWSYTGGAQQMRAWYGSSDENRFFFADPRTVADYKAWIRFVVQRVNPLTGKAYRDDPTIFAWELMNESQAPDSLRASWSASMSTEVKSLDANHMVASGDHGPSMADFTIQTLDFVTWHGYPKYRGITPAKFNALITDECGLAKHYQKTILLEEFGYARSNTNPDPSQAYTMWTDTMRDDPSCAGWLVWRLVARQDDERYPRDEYDQFDVRNDAGDIWRALSAAAHRGRSGNFLSNGTPLRATDDAR